MEGFCSFSSMTKIKFDKGTWFITATNHDGGSKVDSNGSGKTTVLDAIVWAIFGRTSGRRSGKSLISHGHTRCAVRLVLGEYHEELVITREIDKKESISATWLDPKTAEVEPIKGDKDAVQRRLLEILDINFETFCSTVFLGGSSHSTQFLLAQPAERSKILSYLVNDKAFQNAAKYLKEDHDKLEDRYTDLAREVALCQQSIDHHQSNVTLFKHQIDQAEDADRLRKEKIEAEITARKERIHRAEQEYAKVLKSLQTPVDELFNARKTLVGQINQFRTQADTYASKAGIDPNTIQVGSICRFCTQPVTQATKDAQERTYQSQMKMRQQARDAERKAQEQLVEVDRNIQHHNRQEELRDRLLSDVGDMKSDLLHLQDQLLIKPDTSSLARSLKDSEKYVSTYTAKLSKLNSEYKSLPPKIQVLRDLYLGFSKDIKNVMFDLLRDSLEAYTDLYLQSLTEGGFKVTYPSDSKSIREKFEIVLYNGQFQQDLSGYSEGETWRISFAILLALRRVLSDRCRGKLDFVMIDDPIGGLDESGTIGFVDLLRSMSQTECSLVLCTVPKSSFLTSDDNEIRLEKRYGTTKQIR